MKGKKFLLLALVALLSVLALVPVASAQDTTPVWDDTVYDQPQDVAPGASTAAIGTVVNGDFETGNLSGWGTATSNAPNTWFVYSGTFSPLRNFTIAAPPQGHYAATTDQFGRSYQILYQDITLPATGSYSLSFILYYINRSAGGFVTPATLALNERNQQYRVDIIKPSASITSVAAADVLMNLFRTSVGDPNQMAPTPFTFNLAALAGQTVRLRFACVAAQLFMEASIDAVELVSNNQPLSVAANGPASAIEGNTASTTGTVSDPVGNTVALTASIGSVVNNGDGTWSWSFPTTDGPAESQTVTINANDGQGGLSSTTFALTVTNAAPTVGALTLGGASSTACTAGNSVTLDFGFTDPGANDSPWAVDVDWGDGSIHTTYNATTRFSQPQQSHTYAAGTYAIKVTVTDKDGSVGTSSALDGGVSLLYNMTGILAPFNSDGSSVWKYGSTVPTKVRITDCGGTSVAGLAPQIGTQLKSSANPTLAIDEATSTSGADTGTTLRYDATAGQYIYNWASKSVTDGSAVYYMYVREPHSLGQTPTGSPSTGQSYQQFGLKLK